MKARLAILAKITTTSRPQALREPKVTEAQKAPPDPQDPQGLQDQMNAKYWTSS